VLRRDIDASAGRPLSWVLRKNIFTQKWFFELF